MKILLTAGHNIKEQGATAYDHIITEFHYWKTVTRLVSTKYHDNPEVSVDFAARDNGENIELFYELIDDYDLIIECHFNAFNSYANGSEVLILEDEPDTKHIANVFLSVCDTFGKKVRGIVEIDHSEMRGFRNLIAMKQKCKYAMITELFFGDNNLDYMDIEDSVIVFKTFIDTLIKS